MKTELLNELIKNTTYTVDVQAEPDYTQVAVWCKTYDQDWSICYQNGDMNGDHMGEAIYTNDGANCGLIEARNILKDKDGFKNLVDLDTYWSYGELDDLIHEFCDYLIEKESIEQLL